MGEVGAVRHRGRDGPEYAVHVPFVESFEVFYGREFGSLVALAHVLTGSRSHAEDIAQEAMLATCRRWREVAQMEYPAAWARRVCANLATSAVRRRLVESRALLRLRGGESGVSELDVDAAAFWAEVRRLPRRQAQAIALFYIYGCSVGETAAAMGCSHGSVKKHLSRGRAALAQRVGRDEEEQG